MQGRKRGIRLPFDVKLLIVSDEEGTGRYGMGYLVSEHPEIFEDVKSIIGNEFEVEVIEYDKGSESVDMTLVPELFAALKRKDGEALPVPLAVALSYAMGWDALLGLGMSVLAVCCGFSPAVGNPFTVGIAQQLAGLPMFSGMWYRALGFLIFFGG